MDCFSLLPTIASISSTLLFGFLMYQANRKALKLATKKRNDDLNEKRFLLYFRFETWWLGGKNLFHFALQEIRNTPDSVKQELVENGFPSNYPEDEISQFKAQRKEVIYKWALEFNTIFPKEIYHHILSFVTEDGDYPDNVQRFYRDKDLRVTLEDRQALIGPFIKYLKFEE